MQKIIKRLGLACLLLLAFSPSTVLANTIFNIVPNTTSETINPLGPGIGTPINYTVTNTTTKSINQIALTPLYQSTAFPASTTLQSDTCTGATLAPGASCTFQIALARTGQPSSFFLRPRVCGSNNLLCSVPIETNVAQVFVPPPTPPTITNLVPSLTNRSFINIFTTKNIKITFSIPIMPSTVSSSTVTLSSANSNSNIITNGLCTTSDDLTFTCPFNQTLITNQQYTLNISTAVTGTNTGTLAQPYSVSFLTAALVAGDGLNNNYYVNPANNVLSVSTGGSNFTAATFTGTPTGIIDLLSGDSKGRMYFTTSSNQIWQNTITSNAIVFVSDASTSDVYSCSVNENGTFNTCTPTTGFNTPGLLGLTPTDTLLLVPNTGANTRVCPVNTNGSLGTCSSTGFTSTPNTSVTINPAGTIAYVIATQPNYCSISSNGTLSSCAILGMFTTPTSIAIDPAGANLYISTSGNEIQSCPLLPTGAIGTCTIYTPGTLSNINSIAMNPTGSFLYVANGTPTNTVDYCSINSGVVESCTAASPTFTGNVFGLAVNPAGTILYVTTKGTAVQACPINSDGSLGTCTSTGTFFTQAAGVATYNINTGATTGIPTAFTHPTPGFTGNIVALGGGASNGAMYFATDTGQVWKNSLGGTFTQATTTGGTPSGTITQIVSDGVANFCFITSTSQLWCGTGSTFTHITPGFSGSIISLTGTINSYSASATPITFYTSTNQVWQQHSTGATTFDLAGSLSGITGNIVQMATDGLLNTYLITSTNQVWMSASNAAYSMAILTSTPTAAPIGIAGVAGYAYFSNFGGTSLYQSAYGMGPFSMLSAAYLGLVSGYAGQYGNYTQAPGPGFYYTVFTDTNNETWGSMPTTSTLPPFLIQGAFALLTHP